MPAILKKYWPQTVWVATGIFLAGGWYFQSQDVKATVGALNLQGSAYSQKTQLIVEQHDRQLEEQKVLFEEFRRHMHAQSLDVATIKSDVRHLMRAVGVRSPGIGAAAGSVSYRSEERE